MELGLLPGITADADYDKIGNGDGSGYNVNEAWSNVSIQCQLCTVIFSSLQESQG